MIQSSVGSALGWMGRIAQYLGSLYLLAAVVGIREARDWSHSLEAALGEARQRFEELFNLAGDGIALHERVSETACGHFLQVNPAFCALLGYTPQELQDLTPLDILAPEDRQWIAEDIQKLDQTLLRHEKILVAKDGRRIPVEISTRQYPHQGCTMVISMIRDVTERKRAEEAIRENEQFKQAILDAMSAHVAVLDREGHIIAINEPWRRFAVENKGGGDPPAPNTGIGVNYLDICRAARGEWTEGALQAHDGIQAVLEGQAEFFFDEYLCPTLGKQRWFSMVVTALRGRRGRAVVAHTDITVSRELTEKLRSERDRFTRIAATVPGVICSFRRRPDGSACFPYASPAIHDLYGLRPEVLAESAAPLWAMTHPDDLGHLDASITASAQAMTPWRDEFRVRHPIKGEIWVEGHSMPVREPDGSILWHGYVQDITERKRLEEDLRRLATTDHLTGAFNRRYLLQVMETEIRRARRYARPLSLIMFDLDHFKRINDQFGHDQGDAVLKGVAAMGRERLRHSDIFVRWGGEEFMILAPETAMPQALALAGTLRAGFRQLPIAADIGTITASFGVTQYRPDETVDQWLKRVDDLVYLVKREGRDQISYRP
jgi:diguanylate cyclase (GGDEF)-like protein/PAS domain S-box-containing protein